MQQCNDVSTLIQKYSPVFKKTAVNSECVTHESYLKLKSWVTVYVKLTSSVKLPLLIYNLLKSVAFVV